jgi:hypothetical protein
VVVGEGVSVGEAVGVVVGVDVGIGVGVGWTMDALGEATAVADGVAGLGLPAGAMQAPTKSNIIRMLDALRVDMARPPKST